MLQCQIIKYNFLFWLTRYIFQLRRPDVKIRVAPPAGSGESNMTSYNRPGRRPVRQPAAMWHWRTSTNLRKHHSYQWVYSSAGPRADWRSSDMDKLKSVLSGEEARRDDRTILEVKKKKEEVTFQIQWNNGWMREWILTPADCEWSLHAGMGDTREGLHRLFRGGSSLHSSGEDLPRNKTCSICCGGSQEGSADVVLLVHLALRNAVQWFHEARHRCDETEEIRGCKHKACGPEVAGQRVKDTSHCPWGWWCISAGGLD